jgi:hypothetical protein
MLHLKHHIDPAHSSAEWYTNRALDQYWKLSVVLNLFLCTCLNAGLEMESPGLLQNNCLLLNELNCLPVLVPRLTGIEGAW